MVVGEQKLLRRVDDFRFANGFESRAVTVKWLLEWALDQKPEPRCEIRG